MGILFKLACRDFIRRRSMLGFAFLSIVAVCCLIVWFVAGIDDAALTGSAAKDSLGKFDLAFTSDQEFSNEFYSAVKKTGRTAELAYAWQKNAAMMLENFPEGLIPDGMGERKSPMLLGIGADESPFEIEDGRWFRNPMECVVGTPAGKILTAVPGRESSREIKPGDKIRVRTDAGEFILIVTGTFEQKELPAKNQRGGPGGGSSTFGFGFGLGIGGGTMGPAPAPKMTQSAQSPAEKRKGPPQGPPRGRFGRAPVAGPATPSVYVSLRDAGEMTGDEWSCNMVYLRLADGVSEDEYLDAIAKELGTTLEKAKIRTLDARRAKPGPDAEVSPEALIGQAWSAIGLVILASIFIIFTTLSMGVNEKIRNLAMLRTVGFTKTQLAVYILLEGIFLGLLGGTAGLGAGWGLVSMLLFLKTGVFVRVSLTPLCIVFALGCALAGSLVASIVPAWRATCVAPADSMVRRSRNWPLPRLALAGLIGVILLGVIPFFVFMPGPDAKTKVVFFTTAGTLLLGAGFLLFFPWTVVLTEKILGPAAARLFGIPSLFLSKILSGNQWRTLGTTIAVGIGLGLFTAIHIWTSSMLSMFEVPDTIPDTLVRFQEAVLSDDLPAAVRKYPGVRENRFMRVSAAQPELDEIMTGRMREAHAMANNVVALGVDAGTAWRENDPMLRLKFISGSREKAFDAFRTPGAKVCVIPETLAVHGKLKVGDSLRLAKSATRVTQTGRTAEPEFAEYTVCGIIEFPWVWFSKCSGVRVSAGRTAGVIFVPYEAPLEDFGAPGNEFFWFDVNKNITYAETTAFMRAAAEGAMQKLSAPPETQSFSGGTLWDSGINKNHVQIASNESLNNSLNFRAEGVISVMARMPLVILILSTLAVLNTMVVSVRARRWEMGVLRACGVTRSGLVRMILAEALLIGFCACVMSFSFGLFYAWLACGMVEFAPVFGVIAPPLVIPWLKLLTGYSIALSVCLAAGIYPAFAAGLREPASLLQRKCA